MNEETKELMMAEFGFEVNKQSGQPKLPDNYWQKTKTEDTEINTIFDSNLKRSLEDVSIFGKQNKD